MSTYQNFNDIKDAVKANELLVVNLATLRETAGYKRLGKGVLEELTVKLRGIGVDYFPAHVLGDNPNPRGNDEVRLVLADSLLGKLVRAIQEPSKSGDSLLSNTAEDDSAEILEQIRNLVNN